MDLRLYPTITIHCTALFLLLFLLFQHVFTPFHPHVPWFTSRLPACLLDFRTAPGSLYSSWYNIITFIIIIIIVIIIPSLTQLPSSSSSSSTLTQSLLKCAGVGFFYRAWRPVGYFTTWTMSSKLVLLSFPDGWLLMADGCVGWLAGKHEWSVRMLALRQETKNLHRFP